MWWQLAHAKDTLESHLRRHKHDGLDAAYHTVLGHAELGPMRPAGSRPSTVAGTMRGLSVRSGAHAEAAHGLAERQSAPSPPHLPVRECAGGPSCGRQAAA